MRGQLVKLDNGINVRYYSVSKQKTEDIKLHQNECDALNNELPEKIDITFYTVLETNNKTYAKLVHQIDPGQDNTPETWDDIEKAHFSQSKLNVFDWLKLNYRIPLKK